MRTRFILPIIILSVLFTGCATVYNYGLGGRNRDITITSNTADAKVTILTLRSKSVVHEGTTPFRTRLRKGDYIIEVEKEGYEKQQKVLTPNKFSLLPLSNVSLMGLGGYLIEDNHPYIGFLITCSGFLGLIVDTYTGSWTQLPKSIHFDLVKEHLADNPYDTILLNTNRRIEASIVEISDKEIKYKFDMPNAPLRSISTRDVRRIIYSNSQVENFSDKTTFGFSADPSGFALYGPEASLEITSGNWNWQIQTRFTSLGNANDFDGGFGVGLGVNYLTNGRSNGFYLGTVGMYDTFTIGDYRYQHGVFAGTTGYGIGIGNSTTLRIGVEAGGRFGHFNEFVWRPVTSVGYGF